MIRSFRDTGTEDIFNGVNSKNVRKVCPRVVWNIAVRKLDQLDSVSTLDDLKIPPGNRLEPLKNDRKGQYSIRINDQYRLCFVWKDNSSENVEITDCH